MKFLALFLLVLSFKSFADSSVSCELSRGIYVNSRVQISDIRFDTVADIFSLTNAKTLSFYLEGSEMRFLRADIKVSKYAQITFHQKKGNKILRTVHVMIDRTPKKIREDGEFNGNMIISGTLADNADWLYDSAMPKLTYNFKCKL